jgi:hypothetical protein
MFVSQKYIENLEADADCNTVDAEEAYTPHF